MAIAERKDIRRFFRNGASNVFNERGLVYKQEEKAEFWQGSSMDGKYIVGLELDFNKYHGLDHFQISLCYDPEWLYHPYQFSTAKLPPKDLMNKMQIKYSGFKALLHKISQVNIPVDYWLTMPSKDFLKDEDLYIEYANYLVKQLDNCYEEAESYLKRVEKYRLNNDY